MSFVIMAVTVVYVQRWPRVDLACRTCFEQKNYFPLGINGSLLQLCANINCDFLAN